MDLRELKKLVALMNDAGLIEVEMMVGGERVVLKKAPPASVQNFAYAPPQMYAAQPGPAPAPVAGGRPAQPTPPPNDGTSTFNSPMVGTFYLTPNPESPPFVKAGDRVTPDTVLCLIEAMKVFNEIKAEMSGVVVDVLVENQEAVEFNQPLFLIKP